MANNGTECVASNWAKKYIKTDKHTYIHSTCEQYVVWRKVQIHVHMYACKCIRLAYGLCSEKTLCTWRLSDFGRFNFYAFFLPLMLFDTLGEALQLLSIVVV